MTLAVRRSAGDHLHFARRQHAHGRRLPSARAVVQRGEHARGREAAHLEVRRHADAEALACTGHVLLRLLLAHAGVVDDLRRFLRRREMVARVVVESVERGVSGLVALGVEELLALDEVALAQLERIDLHLACERVHRNLDGVGRLGASGAAVGVGRRHRGEHRGAREVVRLGQVVHTGIEERTEEWHAGRDQLQVRAHVADQSHAHRGEAAVFVGGQLDVLNLSAAVDGGLRVLGAFFHPAHGCAVLARERDAEQLFGVHVEFRAEAAADRRRDDAHLVLGDAGGDCRHHLQDVGHLRRGIQRDVAAEGLGHRRYCARLHGHRDEALLHVALVHGVRGVLECFVDRALFGLDLQVPGVRLVRADRVVDDRLVAQRGFEVGDRSERFVCHVDCIECVARCGIARGKHCCDAVADVARLVDCERIVRGVLHVGRDRPRARHRCSPRRHEVSAGVHGDDAGHGRGVGCVDAANLCVRVWRAQHGEMQRAGNHEVVGVLRLAGQQRRVFSAQHARAEHARFSFFGDAHGVVLLLCRCEY